MRRLAAPTAVASTVTVAGVLPYFLTAALAVQMRADLGFSQAALGLALGIYLGVGAVGSAYFGRLADRLGPTPSMRAAALVAAAGAALIALLADRWGVLVVGLVVAGVANALGQPASNLYLTRSVRSGRQGLAFGLKQSAVPTAALLGGAAVPALALTVGWRWAFGIAAVGAVAGALAVPRGSPPAPAVTAEAPVHALRVGPLVLLGAGGAFGFAAATALTGFLVDAAVSAGIGPAPAGLLLSLGSALAIGARLVVGGRADRREGGHLLVVTVMLATGSAGFLLLATARPVLMVAGTVVAFATAWGWSGLYFYAVVTLYPRAPGAAAGLVQSGTFFGGIAGPLVFGGVVQAWGYGPAYVLAGTWSATAALAIGVGRLWDRRRRESLP